jgi:hypothetical protein
VSGEADDDPKVRIPQVGGEIELVDHDAVRADHDAPEQMSPELGDLKVEPGKEKGRVDIVEDRLGQRAPVWWQWRIP